LSKTERTSDDMIQNPDYSYEDRRKFQTIFTEEIEGELISALPGQSTGEKKLKTDILEVVFHSRSWARIKEYSPDLLKSGLQSVKYLCAALKSNGVCLKVRIRCLGSAGN